MIEYWFLFQENEGSGSGDGAREAELIVLPKFLSYPQTINVIRGSSFELNCVVDNLGKNLERKITVQYSTTTILTEFDSNPHYALCSHLTNHIHTSGWN